MGGDKKVRKWEDRERGGKGIPVMLYFLMVCMLDCEEGVVSGG